MMCKQYENCAVTTDKRIAQLHSLGHRLVNITIHPEPGLASWCMAVQEIIAAIFVIGGEL